VNEIKSVGHNTHLSGKNSRQKSKLNCFKNAIYSPYKIRLDISIQYNAIQYETYNAPYVTKMLFVGAMLT